jgi:hypothetical protein
MKKILVALLFVSPLQAKTITLEIPDQDIKIVENDVIDAEQWIREAWAGKLNKCKERLLNQEIKRSVDVGESLPAGDTAIIQKAFNRTDYESRKARDLKIITGEK